MTEIRVLLVEDHAIVRKGLRLLIDRLEWIAVVGEAEDGHEALRKVGELHPDIVLLDISLPGLNGLEVLTRIEKHHPSVRVLMLSMHANEEYVYKALSSGAAGYVLKDSSTDELEFALRTVYRGEIYLSPKLSSTVVSSYVKRNRVHADLDPFSVLTGRQREILQLIAESHSTKAIARKLDISVKTVETHRAKLMARLGITDVPGLVRYTIRTGMVLPNP